MGLTYKTRLFAEEQAAKSFKDRAIGWGNKAMSYPKQGGKWVYDQAEGRRAGAGKWALAGAGALLGGGLGAGIAGITLRGLKGRLREAHPDWSDDKVQREYDRIKKKRLAIGAVGGALVGGIGAGYKGWQHSKGSAAGASAPSTTPNLIETTSNVVNTASTVSGNSERPKSELEKKIAENQQKEANKVKAQQDAAYYEKLKDKNSAEYLREKKNGRIDANGNALALKEYEAAKGITSTSPLPSQNPKLTEYERARLKQQEKAAAAMGQGNVRHQSKLFSQLFANRRQGPGGVRLFC